MPKKIIRKNIKSGSIDDIPRKLRPLFECSNQKWVFLVSVDAIEILIEEDCKPSDRLNAINYRDNAW